MRIRPESAADEAEARIVHAAAFRLPDDPDAVPVEVPLLEKLRASDAWLGRLSMVADVDGRVVGHVVCTRAYLEQVPVLGLGPIGVDPDLQNRGIGTALVHAVVAEADTMGEPLIGLLGDPSYYRRFGFIPAVAVDITAPDPGWGDYFQVKPLSGYRPTMSGRFVYAEPFQRL